MEIYKKSVMYGLRSSTNNLRFQAILLCGFIDAYLTRTTKLFKVCKIIVLFVLFKKLNWLKSFHSHHFWLLNTRKVPCCKACCVETTTSNWIYFNSATSMFISYLLCIPCFYSCNIKYSLMGGGCTRFSVNTNKPNTSYDRCMNRIYNLLLALLMRHDWISLIFLF